MDVMDAVRGGKMTKHLHHLRIRNYVFDQIKGNIVPSVDVCIECNEILDRDDNK